MPKKCTLLLYKWFLGACKKGAWYSWFINKQNQNIRVDLIMIMLILEYHLHAISNRQKSHSYKFKTEKQTHTINTYYQCSHASNIAWSIQIQFFECFLCTKRSIFWVIATFILRKINSELILHKWIQKCHLHISHQVEVSVNSKSRRNISNLGSFW